ncbi:resistance protein [Musa troglodytarum]|uniref:Resistance protein n=1 Tax=Musa troglodytarum TaxID=320322 RepID=A0A9E7JPA0_9LILI|nr:resistance protein [Musa troglodytarum]
MASKRRSGCSIESLITLPLQHPSGLSPSHILLELMEMVRRLTYLVRRGSVSGLSKEIMVFVDPRQEEEYSTILREEVVGRNKEGEEIIDILKQQQSSDCDEWLLMDGDEGKTP